ncbi:MAG: DUF1926 domain-containing protein [Candidatus Tantalella remota]|nr:DUF1926 domain-containing protein [Candidatus Tantalella remota]
MKKANLAMAFHCHQPVFNFDGNMDEAYEKAYLPLLATLERFPGIKASFHFSGNVIEWLRREHPEYIDLIRKMLTRGQIELMGGGCFEPIMAIIPERDRAGQMEMNSSIMKEVFDVSPRGAWVAERVWEPAIAQALHSSGMEYTILDDHHVRKAGVSEKNMNAPYLYEHEDHPVTVFPAVTKLRYTMPFRPPEATLSYMKKIMREKEEDNTCFFFADDGEKFGAWPRTYKWVHKKGWLSDFLSKLEANSEWLRTMTYSEVLDNVPPASAGDLPSSSYSEMDQWSGGDFRNFFKKYPEADRMRKRMTFVSDMIDESDDNISHPGRQRVNRARRELFKAQAGCAYWHGTFGGVYLPHLRAGVYRHLIRARDILEGGKAPGEGRLLAVETGAEDASGETVMRNDFLDLYMQPSHGGGVSELDYRPLSVNLVNIMSRSREEYHDKIRWGHLPRVINARRAILRGEHADIYDVLGIKEKGLKKRLVYDDYRRYSFLTHVFHDGRAQKGTASRRSSHNGFLKGKYEKKVENGEGILAGIFSRKDTISGKGKLPVEMEVIKSVAVGTTPEITFSQKVFNRSGRTCSFASAIEFNFLVWDKRLLSKGIKRKANRFHLEDMYSGACLEFLFDRCLEILAYPVYTVNGSEEGIRKTFQGISVMVGEENRQVRAEGSSNIMVKISIT